MKTQPLFITLLTFLPAEFQSLIHTLLNRIQASSKKTGNLSSMDGPIPGLTNAEVIDWIPATVSLTFKQYFEDGKLDASCEADDEILKGLYQAADKPIDEFISKYKTVQYRKMNKTNFINAFISIASTPMSATSPNAEKRSEDVRNIEAVFKSDDWQTIKEFNPMLFDNLSRATSPAKDWINEEIQITPIEVVQDALMLRSLVEQFDEAGKDLYRAIEQEVSEDELNERDSICNEVYLYILERLMKYRSLEDAWKGRGLTLAVDEIAVRFTKTPAEIIEMFGPDFLCVPGDSF